MTIAENASKIHVRLLRVATPPEMLQHLTLPRSQRLYGSAMGLPLGYQD